MLVVHAHHVLLALGQLADGVDQRTAHAMVLQHRQRVGTVVGHVAVEEVVAVVARQILQVEELRTAHLAQQLLVVAQQHAHLVGDLALAGCALQPLLELVHCGLDRPLMPPVTAAHPVAAAQLVEHRAADALGGEGLELHALAGVEARQRIVEADHADLDQVVEFDVGRQLGDHLVRQTAHQRAVLLEQRVGFR